MGNKKVYASILLGLGILALVFFGWQAYGPEQRDFEAILSDPDIREELNRGARGFHMAIYQGLFAHLNDDRLEEMSAYEYVAQGDVEAVLVENADGTFSVMVAENGGAFTTLADATGARTLALSSEGELVAFSYFVGERPTSIEYVNMDNWRTRILSVSTGEVVSEEAGYGPQFYSEDMLLLGNTQGVVGIELSSGERTDVGLLPPTIGSVPFVLNEDQSRILVSDFRARAYYVFDISMGETFDVTNPYQISMEQDGVMLGAFGSTLLFAQAQERGGPVTVFARSFEPEAQREELFTISP